MKTSRIFLVVAAAALAMVSAGAQAMGIDLHAFLAPHADAMAGLGMVAAGSIELVMKSLDGI